MIEAWVAIPFEKGGSAYPAAAIPVPNRRRQLIARLRTDCRCRVQRVAQSAFVPRKQTTVTLLRKKEEQEDASLLAKAHVAWKKLMAKRNNAPQPKSQSRGADGVPHRQHSRQRP